MIRFVVTGTSEEEAFTMAQDEFAKYHGRTITRRQVFQPTEIRTICDIMDNRRLWDEIMTRESYDDHIALMFPIIVKTGREPRWLVALNTKE